MQTNSSIISEIFFNFLKGETEVDSECKVQRYPGSMWAYLKADILKSIQRNS